MEINDGEWQDIKDQLERYGFAPNEALGPLLWSAVSLNENLQNGEDKECLLSDLDAIQSSLNSIRINVMRRK